MLTPDYTPKIASVAPDVYKAVYDFVAAFSLSGSTPLLPSHIYRGWENRAALPAGSNDYSVITIHGSTRRNTTIETMPGTGALPTVGEALSALTYYEVSAQVDICSDHDTARVRIYSLDSIYRSSIGVNFFQKYGISALYGSNIREMTFTDESSQFVKRYGLDLSLAYWAGVTVESSWFDNVDLGVINVDVKYPPKET